MKGTNLIRRLNLNILLLFAAKYEELKYHLLSTLSFRLLGTTKQHKSRPQNARKCICESLDFQNFKGEHAPPPQTPYRWEFQKIKLPAGYSNLSFRAKNY